MNVQDFEKIRLMLRLCTAEYTYELEKEVASKMASAGEAIGPYS